MKLLLQHLGIDANCKEFREKNEFRTIDYGDKTCVWWNQNYIQQCASGLWVLHYTA